MPSGHRQNSAQKKRESRFFYKGKAFRLKIFLNDLFQRTPRMKCVDFFFSAPALALLLFEKKIKLPEEDGERPVSFKKNALSLAQCSFV